MYSRLWDKGGGSLAPTGARLGTALVLGWSRLFIKLDCVKGGPITPEEKERDTRDRIIRVYIYKVCSFFFLNLNLVSM